MQELIDKVKELVAFELDRANTIHPPKFNSMHEAYAVVTEEVDEAEDEWQRLGVAIETAWCEIKADADAKEVDKWLIRAENIATAAAAELIQVAAMSRKARL